MRIILPLLALVITGCKEKIISLPTESEVTAIQVPESKLTDQQKITLLRVEAHKRGLRWHVYCVEDERFKGFQASARQKSEPIGASYIEDGAKDYWIERGDTQANAAYALYLAIQEQARFHPDHKPKQLDSKSCPKELRGE